MSDPCRLFAFDALVIELIARALEDEELVAEPLEIFRERLIDRERLGRKQPVFLREKTFEGGEYARRRTSSVRRTFNVNVN